LEDPEEIVRITLELNGTNIGFSTRTPTSQEGLYGCQHLHLSSQHDWDPGNLAVPQFELSALDKTCETLDDYDGHDCEEIHNPDIFSRRLVVSCQVNSIPKVRGVQEVLTDVKRLPTFVTEDRRADVSPQSLADRWMIGLEQSKLTLKSTTQQCLSSADHGKAEGSGS
jgi:hypothetical protein